MSSSKATFNKNKVLVKNQSLVSNFKVSFEDGLIIVICKWVLEFQTKTNWLPKLLVSEEFHKKSLSGYEANGFYIQISYAKLNNFL